jgi:hypothetical protein
LAAALLLACTGTEGYVLSVVGNDAPEAGAPFDAGVVAPPGPTSITVAEGGTTSLQGGTGGNEHVDVCPGDQVLVGLQGTIDDPGIVLVGSVQGLCGSLGINGARVTVTPGASLSTWGGDGGPVTWTEACPAGEVMVGVEGRSGAALDAIAVDCARWTVETTDAGAALTMGSTDTSATNGGDGGTAFSAPCPSGEMARGSDLRAGFWIDAYGLVCGVPTLH